MEFIGFEVIVVVVGGYSINVFVIGYLFDKWDLIIYDEYMYNSGVMGVVMFGVKCIVFLYNNMDVLK